MAHFRNTSKELAKNTEREHARLKCFALDKA
jgi:hypothetical protein